MYEAKLNHIPLVRKTDENKLFSYSREAGTEKLIKIIESNDIVSYYYCILHYIVTFIFYKEITNKF